MAAADGSYLPPVVIAIAGDDRDFIDTVAEVKAVLADLAKSITDLRIGLDPSRALEELQALKAEIAGSMADMRVGINPARAVEGIEILRAEAQRPITIPVSVNIAAAAAEMAAVRAATGAAAHVGADAGIAKLLTGASIGAALGFGPGGGGFFASLMAPLTTLSTLFSAKFMSLGALAGFGPEHLAMTGVGLAGSAIGGGLGAGLLGLGSLGVMGTGFATDMAGIGQAAGDIKQYGQLQSNMAQMAAVYGKGSLEYKNALYEYQQWAGYLSKGTIAALAAASQTENAFHTMFDKVTANAETTGAEIINQAMKVGETFLPTIGKYAATNMTIIQKDLQPLFSWLQGPGLAILNELEQKFTSDLPTAMSAFDNGVELLAKTIGYIAPQTGGFLDHLSAFLSKENTTGFESWITHIQSMINLFRTWDSFIKILVTDIAEIFGFTAGLGKGIVGELTGYLDQLHKVLTTSGDDDSLSKLFQVHKTEVMDLIKVLIQLGQVLTRIYLSAAPFLTVLATDVLKVISALISFTSHLPGGADALGIALILAKFSLLGPIFTGVTGKAGLLETALAGIGKTVGQLLVKIPGVEALGKALGGVGSSLGFKAPGGIFGASSGAAGAGDAAADAGAVDAEGAIKGVGTAAAETTGELAGGTGLIAALGALGGATLGVGVIVAGLGIGLVELQKHFHIFATGQAFPLASWQTSLATVQKQLAALNKQASLPGREAAGGSVRVDFRGGIGQSQDTTEIDNYNNALKGLSSTLQLTKAQALAFQQVNQIDLFGASTSQSEKFDKALQSVATTLGTTPNILARIGISGGETMTTVATDVGTLEGALNNAWQQMASGAEASGNSTAKALASTLSSGLPTILNFANNVQTALAHGFNPTFIENLAKQGPAVAGTEMQNLAKAQGGTLQTLLTDTSKKYQTEMTSITRIVSISTAAAAAGNKAIANQQAAALAIAMALASNNVTTGLASVMTKFHLTYPQILNIAHDYAMAVPNAVNGQLGNTARAGAATGEALLGGLQGVINAQWNAIISKVTGLGTSAGNALRGALQASANNVSGFNGNAKTYPTIPGVPGSPTAGTNNGVNGMNVTAHFNIYAPGGNPAQIKTAIEQGSAQQFAKQTLASLLAGAGTVT